METGYRPCAICKTPIKAIGNHKYCPNCKRQAQLEACRKYNLAHRGIRTEKDRLRRMAKKVQEEEALRFKPQYSIGDVNRKAEELGISYGKCSQLIREGKILMTNYKEVG